VKNFLMLMFIVWFIFGASAAYDRGFFKNDYPRDCSHVGAASLTVIAGPLNYVVTPRAKC
jgi:uncharacterized membrane protein YphA (DoxX/SURF4 family)